LGGSRLRRPGHGDCYRLHLRHLWHHRLGSHHVRGLHSGLLKLRGSHLERLWLGHHRWGHNRRLNIGHAGSHRR
jgi:hypothetical protein